MGNGGKLQHLKYTMKIFIIGIGGVTNGGKTTLANKLKTSLPNCSVICQDDYFKSEAEVETDERGFKMFDVLEALNMEDMMTTVHHWIKHPNEAEASNQMGNDIQRKSKDGIYFLIIEGFLLYSYKPLDSVFTRRYFLTVSYEECKKRRSTRVYMPPDPPGFFEGHVWPMYLKHKDQMEEHEREIVYLDGTKFEDDIFSFVYDDIIKAAQEYTI